MVLLFLWYLIPEVAKTMLWSEGQLWALWQTRMTSAVFTFRRALSCKRIKMGGGMWSNYSKKMFLKPKEWPWCYLALLWYSLAQSSLLLGKCLAIFHSLILHYSIESSVFSKNEWKLLQDLLPHHHICLCVFYHALCQPLWVGRVSVFLTKALFTWNSVPSPGALWNVSLPLFLHYQFCQL